MATGKPEFEDWASAYDNGRAYEEKLAEAQKQIESYGMAINSLSESKAEDEDKNLALGSLQKEAQLSQILVPWLQLGSKKANDEFTNLSKKENLESILKSFKSDELKSIVNNIYFTNPEEAGRYESAAVLQAEIKDINNSLGYLDNGDLNRNMEKKIENLSLGLIQEHYNDIYSEEEDSDYALIKQGLNLIALKDEDFRLAKYTVLAPELMKKKEKEFYVEIGGSAKKNLIDYVSETIDEESIPQLYQGISQYLATKSDESV